MKNRTLNLTIPDERTDGLDEEIDGANFYDEPDLSDNGEDE
jgi:hypothetical protein